MLLMKTNLAPLLALAGIISTVSGIDSRDLRGSQELFIDPLKLERDDELEAEPYRYPPTSCTLLQKELIQCLRNELTTSQANKCMNCINDSVPPGNKCTDALEDFVCDGPENCECGDCSDEFVDFSECRAKELFGCEYECDATPTGECNDEIEEYAECVITCTEKCKIKE